MTNEEKIVNKIIPVEDIIKIANYLEKQKEDYQRIFDNEKQKNMNLNYNEQRYEHKNAIVKIQYIINFKDGMEISDSNYNWFIEQLNNLKKIEKISFSMTTTYFSNIQTNNYEYNHLYVWVNFREDAVSIKVDAKGTEDQAYKIYSKIEEILNDNEERYNKTIKNRELRIQSLSLSIGIILTYILYIVLLMIKTKIPNEIMNFINNKFVIIFGQWLIAAIIGNIIGYPIMMNLYKNIIPKRKFSYYSKSSKEMVYVDNIDDFTSHNEVQIGNYTDNGKNREKIEKIYKITSKIVLIQIVLSILFFVIIK